MRMRLGPRQVMCGAGSLVGLCYVAVIGLAGAECEYGTLPGYWDGFEYRLADSQCQLRRHVDAWASLPAAREADHILLIGDSFDRQIVQAAALYAGGEAEDYTPVALDRGEPSKIGRNLQVTVGAQYLGNLFVFGANNRGDYAEPALAGAVDGMHNLTYAGHPSNVSAANGRGHERICSDFRRFSPYEKDPSMIVINSVLWDVMQWYMEHGRKGWEQEDYNVPPELSSRRRAKNIYQVFEPGPEGPVWREALRQYEDDISSLILEVRRCFPATSLLCWRTAPLPATDSRARHFWLKPPYVTAAFNSIGRHIAHRFGLCVVDMDRMLQGRGNDGSWVPDGSHPKDEVLVEYVNVLLNILMQHKEDATGSSAARDNWRQAKREPPRFSGASIRSHRPHTEWRDP